MASKQQAEAGKHRRPPASHEPCANAKVIKPQEPWASRARGQILQAVGQAVAHKLVGTGSKTTSLPEQKGDRQGAGAKACMHQSRWLAVCKQWEHMALGQALEAVSKLCGGAPAGNQAAGCRWSRGKSWQSASGQVLKTIGDASGAIQCPCKSAMKMTG